MIMDRLENAHLYTALNPGFARGFAFLARPDVGDLPAGRQEIDGERIYALIVKAPGRRIEDAELEAHEKYIDIQLVLAGTDDLGWKNTSLCRSPSGDYDAEGDCRLYGDRPDASLSMKPGVFTILFPDDAHAPMISDGELHKAVVKVAVHQG